MEDVEQALFSALESELQSLSANADCGCAGKAKAPAVAASGPLADVAALRELSMSSELSGDDELLAQAEADLAALQSETLDDDGQASAAGGAGSLAELVDLLRDHPGLKITLSY
jgi:hypothetical protein